MAVWKLLRKYKAEIKNFRASMSSQSGYIPIGGERLHYLKWGSGKKLLIAFHGYGNDADIFSIFEPYLQNEYSVVAFDLPHHGKSKWRNDHIFKWEYMVEIIDTLKKAYKVDKFSLLGYSIGGRISLSIIEHMPQVIDKVLLIAPDGLAFTPIYHFTVVNPFSRGFFKNVVERPQKVIRMMDWMRDKKWVKTSTHRFAMQYLESKESRTDLVQRWTCLKELVPERKRVKKIIKKYKVPITIYVGAFDKVIAPGKAQKFKDGLDTVHVHILNKGHRVFDYDNAKQIARHLL